MIDKDAFSQLVLGKDAGIAEAINILNRASQKIVLVVDASGKLIGTITDGDLRRGLLKGSTLSSPVVDIMNENPIALSVSTTDEQLLRVIKDVRLQHIPIVGENYELLGLRTFSQLEREGNRNNLMVVMAGGKGSRLLPRTANIPKPMLNVTGKPILEHIVNRAQRSGFNKFVFAIHHLGSQIEEYFGDGSGLGVAITYTREELPLGTAGALTLLDPKPNDAFVVTNGDVLTDINYGDLLDYHLENEAVATMAVQSHEIQNPFGVVETNGVEIVNYIEKPLTSCLINAGVYVLDPIVLGGLDKGRAIDMPSLFTSLKEKSERIVAYPIHEKWLDLGLPRDFERASQEFYDFGQ